MKMWCTQAVAVVLRWPGKVKCRLVGCEVVLFGWWSMPVIVVVV